MNAVDAPHLLLVEDNTVTRETLVRDFSSLGCRMTVARSAEEARGALERGLSPHVIILDFRLPGQSGPAFFRSMTEDDRYRRIPVVPFTSLVNSREPAATPILMDFVSTREAQNNRDSSQAIVPKGDSETVTVTPPALLIAVAHGLQTRNVKLPAPYLKTMRPLLKDLFGTE
jgi:CheY-like chemotaxis protein